MLFIGFDHLEPNKMYYIEQHTLDGRRVCDIPNAGINHVSCTNGQWQVVSWADTEHLADLPPQPVYHQTQLKA